MEIYYRSHAFSFFEILREGWKLYISEFKKFFLIALVVFVPFLILGNLLLRLRITTGDPRSATYLLLSCFDSLLAVAVLMFVLIGVAYLVEQKILGHSMGLATALRYALSKLPAAFLIELLLILMIGIGFVLLVIPGIIVVVYLAFALPILALRNPGIQSIQYSIDLVKGQWLKVFGYSFGIGLIAGVFSFCIAWLSLVTSSYIGSGTLLIGFIGNLGSILFLIFQVVFFLNQDYMKHQVETITVAPSPVTVPGLVQ